MTRPSAEQILLAAKNTREAPRNTAPQVKQAIQNERREPTDCPKFNGCSAPVCPLDADWRKRAHLDGERACFYLTEYAKPAARAMLRGVLPSDHYEALAVVFHEVLTRPGPLKKQLGPIWQFSPI